MKKIILLISLVVLMFVVAGCVNVSDKGLDVDKEAAKDKPNIAGKAFTTECEKTCPYANWLGDKWCDDGSPGSYDPKYNCNTEACDWDGGDCGKGKPSGPYCTDSDNGKDLTQKGIVESHYASGDVANSFPDSCVDANTVEEMTCFGTQPVSTNFKCENGVCKDGACIIALQGTPGDLSKYPEQFIGEDYGLIGEKLFDGFLVVGENGPALDNLAITDIVSGMKYNGKLVIFIDSGKLDSEITYPAGDDNLIIVGSPCVNSVSAEVEGFPADCKNGLKEGKSYIKLMKWPNGNHYLLITGITGESRRVAAKVLATRSNELSGSEVEISGSNYQTATITKIK